MSIEAMKLALEALEGINDEDRDKDFLTLKQFVRLDMATEALRTALQQAEAKTDVRCEGCGYMTHHREHMGCVRAAKQFTHPAPGVPDALKDHQIAALVNKVRDIARMFHDHQSLRERIAIELVPALKASQEVKSNAERWRTFLATRPSSTHEGIIAAIDAAMLAAK